MQKNISIELIVPVLFFISGAAGLVYEVIWVDLLTNLLGASTLAVTMILASFMGGLAAGSYTVGLFADNWSNKKVAVFYLFVEVAIGLYALSFPFIVNGIESFYIYIFNLLPSSLIFTILLKALFSFFILIVPTFLMGTTLPLISKFLSKSRNRFSLNISLLYGLNTLGAIFGTLIAGFYLLENYGISGATKFSASINFTVAFIFLILFLVYKNSINEVALEKKKKSVKISDANKEFIILLLISYALCGAASMFYQVSWTRALSLVLGTSTYAFTTMLATFLLGIALGSIFYGYIKTYISNLRLYLITQIIVVLSVLFLSLTFDKLPLYYLSFTDGYFQKWIDIHYIRFFISSFIMLIPTLAMGVLFPAVCDTVFEYSNKMSHSVGKVYAVNSLGAMIGAVLAGLAVVPSVGLQNTVYVGVFLNFFAFVIVLLQTSKISFKEKSAYGAFILIFIGIFLIFMHRWSPRMMSSGVYVYSDNYFYVSDKFEKIDKYGFSKEAVWEASMKNFDLLYYKDGMLDTVAVMKNKQGILSLMVNGKVDASAKGEMDVATQIMIGQLPLLLHKDPKEVFLVGYASGITAGSILTHDIQNLTVAEISKAVIEASHYFDKYNNNPLSDQRTNLKLNDARQMLMTSNKTYDVIVSQPSNPWIKGQSSLFSYDWYKIVKFHLKNEGVFMQWVPSYSISESNIKIILHTICSVFPNVNLWRSPSKGDLIILATNQKDADLSKNLTPSKIDKTKIRLQLEKLNLNSTEKIKDLYLKNDSNLRDYLYGDNVYIPLNTDDKLITEYTTPKNMINSKTVDIFTK